MQTKSECLDDGRCVAINQGRQLSKDVRETLMGLQCEGGYRRIAFERRKHGG